MYSVFEALSLLTPYDIDKPKVRLGPAADGGYVFADDFGADQPIMSYGIGKQYEFDRQMAERGHQIYMFDHTIRGIKAPHPNMHYFKQGVAGRTDAANDLYSLADHIEMNGIASDRIILKMDVEGAEYDALGEVDEATLGRIDQIVLELHGLKKLWRPQRLEVFTRMMTKLNRHFTLFHVHANNYDGRELHVLSGMPVCNVLELSYIKSSRVRRSPSTTLYPTPLDQPNVPWADKLLWFYPFLPTTAGIETFRAGHDRNAVLPEPAPGRPAPVVA